MVTSVKAIGSSELLVIQVSPGGETVTWPNGADIDPDVLDGSERHPRSSFARQPQNLRSRRARRATRVSRTAPEGINAYAYLWSFAA
jgi:hypothetical protein